MMMPKETLITVLQITSGDVIVDVRFMRVAWCRKCTRSDSGGTGNCDGDRFRDERCVCRRRRTESLPFPPIIFQLLRMTWTKHGQTSLVPIKSISLSIDLQWTLTFLKISPSLHLHVLNPFRLMLPLLPNPLPSSTWTLRGMQLRNMGLPAESGISLFYRSNFYRQPPTCAITTQGSRLYYDGLH